LTDPAVQYLLPAGFVSKNHWSPFFTIGTGKGQSSFPNTDDHVVLFRNNAVLLIIRLQKPLAPLLSSTASPEKNQVFCCSTEDRQKLLIVVIRAAVITAFTASSGDANVFCFCAAGASLPKAMPR